jgi:hypothetical protein
MGKSFDEKKCKAYAGLEIEVHGEDIDAEEISRRLGIEISYVQKMGDHKKVNICNGVMVAVYPGGIDWAYQTEKKNTRDLAMPLDELVDVFKKKIDKINSIKNTYRECEVTVYIEVWIRNKKFLPGIYFSSEQLKFITEIGASLELDIHNK